MKNNIKKAFNGVKEKMNKILDIASLNAEIKYLQNELEESKSKEKPYIDKISVLKSDLRVMKILNTKLENKVKKLETRIKELEQKENNFFGEI